MTEMPSPAAGRKRTWILSLLLVAMAGWALIQRHSQAEEPAKRRPELSDREVPVAAVPVERADIGVYVSGLGSVQSPSMVTVTSQVTGQLMRINFEEGQFVHQGDLLAVVDTRPFEAQLAQYEGQLLRDQALLKNARADLARYRTLVAQDSGTQQQLDTQAALVKQYEGAIKVDQGQIDGARLQITYSNITAPISGRLGLRQIDAGNIVQAGSSNGLVVIAQMQPINVTFTIPEDRLPEVLENLRDDKKLPVEVFDRSGKHKLAAGLLLTIDNQIDSATGTIKLKAEFANADLALFPNQFVNVRMRTALKHDSTVVPDAAIQHGAQGTFVYVAEPNGTVSIRNVSLGPSDAGKIAIEEGLSAGEQVVVEGADKLREGSKIKLITPRNLVDYDPAQGKVESQTRSHRRDDNSTQPETVK